MKTKKTLKSCLLIILTVTFLGLCLAGTFGNASDGNRGDILFEVVGPEFIRSPATKARLKILSANVLKNQGQVKLKRIRVFDSQQHRVFETTVDKNLENISRKIEDAEVLKQLLGFAGQDAAETQRQKRGRKVREIVEKLHTQKIDLDLREVNSFLQVGDITTFRLVGDFEVSGEPIQSAQTISIYYAASLPSISDWYPGDGHIHTAFSDAPLYSVDERAYDAKNNCQFKWVIMTDHAQQLDFVSPNGDMNGDYGKNEWELENTECSSAQNKHSIAVMNGEEISTKIHKTEGYDSHYLGYNLGTFFCNYYNAGNNPLGGQVEYRDGQQIISAVNAQNSDSSFGVIAHPYWTTYKWLYWGANGYSGIELMSGMESPLSNVIKTPDAQTISMWDNLLASGKHVTGLANSDAHYPVNDAYGKIMTYLYMPGFTSTSHTAVYDALKNGRTVASTGPLVVFKIGDKLIGETVSLSGPATLTLDIQWSSTATFGNIKTINIYANGNSTPVKTLAPNSLSGSASVSLPVQDSGYFRIVGKSQTGTGKNVKYFYAYTSPIYISIRQGKGWPMYRYDETNSGVNTEETSLYPPLRLKFKKVMSEYIRNWNTPVVSKGTIYVSTTEGMLYAISTRTGCVKWQTYVGTFTPSPSVVDGILYCGTETINGYGLSAYDAKTGTIIWSNTGYGSPITPSIVANGTVYFGSAPYGAEQKVVALDASSGNLKWETNVGYGVSLYNEFDYGRAAPTVIGGVVYVAARGSSSILRALDANNGSILWSNNDGGWSFNIWTPVIVNGVVAKDGEDNLNNNIHSVNAVTGALLWNARVRDERGFYTAHNGKFYINTTEALDASSGSKVLSFSGGMNQPSTIANGVLWGYREGYESGIYQQYFTAFDPNTGAKLWEYPLGGYVGGYASTGGSPAIADGEAYFVSKLGYLYAFTNYPPTATRLEDNDNNIAYSGTWSTSLNSSASGGSYHCAQDIGASAELAFTGSSVSWVTMKGLDMGKAEVYIDGALKGTIDLYSRTASYQVKQTYSGLEPTDHRILIKTLGSKNNKSTGTKVVVDAFDITL